MLRPPRRTPGSNISRTVQRPATSDHHLAPCLLRPALSSPPRVHVSKSHQRTNRSPKPPNIPSETDRARPTPTPTRGGVFVFSPPPPTDRLIHTTGTPTHAGNQPPTRSMAWLCFDPAHAPRGTPWFYLELASFTALQALAVMAVVLNVCLREVLERSGALGKRRGKRSAASSSSSRRRRRGGVGSSSSASARGGGGSAGGAGGWVPRNCCVFMCISLSPIPLSRSCLRALVAACVRYRLAGGKEKGGELG